MRYPNGSSSGNKARGRLTSWLGMLLAAAGGRVFARDDATAARYGWQVTVRRGGLARSYRDPRFAALHRCPLCQGDGWGDGAPCAGCDGTGRVTVASPGPAAYREGRSR